MKLTFTFEPNMTAKQHVEAIRNNHGWGVHLTDVIGEWGKQALEHDVSREMLNEVYAAFGLLNQGWGEIPR